jgi:16S rRNA (cytosine1402-N4)-methyltransferase
LSAHIYPSGHIPVLLDETLDGLAIRAGGTYVDATFGAGGHTKGLLARLEGGRVIAFDVDTSVPRFEDPALILIHANFRDMAEELHEREIREVDGVLFDFGVSSMQLDTSERGFSFQSEAPLDMRMAPSDGPSARDLLEESSERQLADMLFLYGEERAARPIARALVRARLTGRFPKSTLELARLVAGVTHRPGKRERLHPATRTFQALRIVVNDELNAIRLGLEAAAELLSVGGRIAAISYHSLEDRIVKRAFLQDERLTALTRKPILPLGSEIDRNPRARSARLRLAQRNS